MSGRPLGRNLAGLGAAVVTAATLAAGTAGPAQAGAAVQAPAHSAPTSASVQASGWTPVGAYQTSDECGEAAYWFGGYATCTYVGGSYPWILWVWTW